MRNANRTKIMIAFALLLIIALPAVSFSQGRVRHEINIPDIRGYTTLKCDFHMHTVFSDGSVWPTIRAEEVWRDGLDVFSISDHIEYQPHKGDIPTNHNRSYDIAKPVADAFNTIIIKATEFTRSTPPGHHNALFVTDIDALDIEDLPLAVKTAADQGAFIFYNHPGWKHPERTAEWFPFQEGIYEKGHLHGVEIVNGKEYFPLAHKWCIEKKLTLLANSDVHNPIGFNYDAEGENHRPVTLVFVKTVSEKGIKDALFARRTAIWSQDKLIGDEKYLRPLFNESIEIVTPQLEITGKGSTAIQIRNYSDVTFQLEAAGESDVLTFPGSVTLPAGKTAILTVRGTSVETTGKKKISLPYTVKNLIVAPDESLSEELSVSVRFNKP